MQQSLYCVCVLIEKDTIIVLINTFLLLCLDLAQTSSCLLCYTFLALGCRRRKERVSSQITPSEAFLRRRNSDQWSVLHNTHTCLCQKTCSQDRSVPPPKHLPPSLSPTLFLTVKYFKQDPDALKRAEWSAAFRFAPTANNNTQSSKSIVDSGDDDLGLKNIPIRFSAIKPHSCLVC